MSCAHMQALLHGSLDGEIDLVNAVRFEEHLKTCEACAAEYRRQQELRTAVRQPRMRHAAPEHLRRRIESAIAVPAAARARPAMWWQRLFADWRVGAAASLAFAASLILFVATPGNGDRLQQELIAGHIRSLQANHLTDVASSDQHTVKPWFSGKLDVAPPVVDLVADGFPLVGGRLDYIGGHEAAALVYRRHQHVINLFVWPARGEADASPLATSHEGYNLLHWTRAEMSFWAVSELNSAEIREFATIYGRAMAKAN